MSKINVLDVAVDNISISEAVTAAMTLIKERHGGYVVTPNSEIILDAQKNRKLMGILNQADMVLPDGEGVVAASKILGTPLRGKLAGIDFASALMARMSEQEKSVYLFGGKPDVADMAAERLGEKYPGLRIVGTDGGYFIGDDDIIGRINDAKPDFLLVCLGSPKQELWMARNAGKLDIGLMAGLGGALDVYSGKSSRAPLKWREMGLEWLYRLVKEPKRLKRMLRLPGIILKALGRRIGG